MLTFDCKRSNLQLDLAGLGRAVRLLAAASFDLGRAHRHAGGVQPQVHRRQLAFDVRPMLYTLLGVDLTQIHGLGPYNALKLVSECGTDMSRWPTCKHFTSWLSLARGNKISGGRVPSSKTRRSANRAAALLRLAATTLSRTDTALDAFYRRLSGRVGKAKAVTATARKIAVLFYNTMLYGMQYADPGASHYEQRYRQRAVANLRRRAKALGFTLQEPSDGSLLVVGVVRTVIDIKSST